MTDDFDPHTALAQVRERRQRRRLPRYWRGRSQLDRHAAELLQLHDAGASANDLREWLQVTHRLRVDRSTVTRWLQKALARRHEHLTPAPDEPR